MGQVSTANEVLNLLARLKSEKQQIEQDLSTKDAEIAAVSLTAEILRRVSLRKRKPRKEIPAEARSRIECDEWLLKTEYCDPGSFRAVFRAVEDNIVIPGEVEIVSRQKIKFLALYALARAPGPVRQALIKRAGSGERLTTAVVDEAVAEYLEGDGRYLNKAGSRNEIPHSVRMLGIEN